jgi:hypothetical protein
MADLQGGSRASTSIALSFFRFSLALTVEPRPVPVGVEAIRVVRD